MAITQLIKNGDIVLYRGTSLLAKLIRFFINYYYNHAGIYKDGYIYESLGNGIVKTKFETTLLDAEAIAVYGWNGDPKYLTEAVNKMDEYESNQDGYDWKALLIFQPIYQMTGYWLGQESKRRMTCTEFVARVYPVFYEMPDMVDAKDIANNSNFSLIFSTKLNGTRK